MFLDKRYDREIGNGHVIVCPFPGENWDRVPLLTECHYPEMKRLPQCRSLSVDWHISSQNRLRFVIEEHRSPYTNSHV